MRNTKFRIPLIIIILMTGVLLGTQIQKAFAMDGVMEGVKSFNTILTFAQKYYVDEVDTDKLVEAALNGMFEALDPHSVYIPKKQLQGVQEEFRGDFEGVGIEFQIVNDTLTVVSPITGGPSEALGIMAGDRIVKIDGKTAIGITNDEVRKRLRGPAKTKVTVTIQRPGLASVIEYEIIRDKIPLYSVDTHLMIDQTTGYVSVSRFAEKTTAELEEALADLKSKGMKQLVFDLRNNPGGYLNQAFQIADLFIDGEKKIVYTKGRRKEFDEEYNAGRPSEYENIPVIFLINRGSASASEIVTGAVQDWDRGLIVGETSFGKGLVQRQFPLDDGSAFRLTISQYYTPSGRWIQRKYSDKKKYYEELSERDEEEKEDFDHKKDGDSTRPVYKTAKGRTVFGGGGITPDYIVKSGKITELTSSMLRKNVFYQYILKYVETKGASIKSQYGNDLVKFNESFNFTQAEVDDFLSFAKSKEVTIKDTDWQTDKEYILARLKAQLGRNYWKNEGWYSVLLREDKQMTKALSLFGIAQQMVKK